MIEFQHVSLAYEDKPVLKPFDLTIGRKERLVILGASGSGKTSLLRLIAGLIVPTTGEIKIDRKTVSRPGTAVVAPNKREVGMVFQDLALWPHMTVEENISFGLKLKHIDKKKRHTRVDELLSLMGLPGYGERHINQLSGGEQQRVALARALILSPKVLLMDEPLSSLDTALNLRLRKEIVRLQETFGFTLVYVTHNEEEAKEIGTRILLMETLDYAILKDTSNKKRTIHE